MAAHRGEHLVPRREDRQRRVLRDARSSRLEVGEGLVREGGGGDFHRCLLCCRSLLHCDCLLRCCTALVL